MSVRKQTIEVSRFAVGVAAGWCTWEDCVGQKINHDKFGAGTISATVQSGADRIVIAHFNDGDRQLNGSFFGAGFFSTMTLPAEICARIAAAEAHKAAELNKRAAEHVEQEQRQDDFNGLLAALWQGIDEPPTVSYDEVLLGQLREVHTGNELTAEAIAALRSRLGADIEATYYERRAAQSGDRRHLITASQRWSEAQRPARVLEIADPVEDDPTDLAVALLTAQASAHRELHQLDDALSYAQRAHKLDATAAAPAILLGGLSYERREFVAGDRFFVLATEHSATSDQINAEIVASIRRLTVPQRRAAINHLTKRNPDRVDDVKRRLEKA